MRSAQGRVGLKHTRARKPPTTQTRTATWTSVRCCACVRRLDGKKKNPTLGQVKVWVNRGVCVCVCARMCVCMHGGRVCVCVLSVFRVGVCARVKFGKLLCVCFLFTNFAYYIYGEVCNKTIYM